MTVIFGPTLSLGIDATPASDGAGKFRTAIDQVDSYGLKATRSVEQVDKSIVGLGKSFTDLPPKVNLGTIAIGGFIGGLAVGVVQQFVGSLGALATEAIRVTDAYQNLDSRIRLVTDGMVPLQQAHQDLFEISQKTSQSFESTGDLFTNLARNSKELGLGYEDLLGITESINQSLVVGGASAQAASAGLEQLGQAFGSGRLSGDEFRSVMEHMPVLAQAIADGLGVTIGKLREMAEAGELTAKVVADAIASQSDVISEKYNTMGDTVERATTRMQNALNQLTVDTTNASGAQQGLIDILNTLTQVFQSEGLRSGINIYITLIADMVKGVGLAVSVIDALVGKLGKLSTEAGSVTSKIAAASKALGNEPTGGTTPEEKVRSFIGEQAKIKGGSPIDKAITLEQSVTIKQKVTREVVSVKDGGFGPEIPVTGGLTPYKGQVDRPVARPRGTLGYEAPEPKSSRAKSGGGGRSSAESEAKRIAAEQERLDKQREQSARQAYDTLSNLNTQYLQQLSSTLQAQDKLGESFDAEEQKLQVMRERELQHLDTLEMSAEQKAQAIDLVNKRYALLTDAITFKRGEAVLDKYKGDQAAAFGSYTNLEAGAQFPQIDLTESSQQIDSTFTTAGDRLTEFGEKLLSMDNTVNLVTQSIASIGSTAASAFADAIIEGESFADTLEALGKSLTKMLLTMTLQLAFQQALGGGAIGLGGLLGGGTTGATVAHGGGIIGRESFKTRDVPLGTFTGAPKFHQGGMTRSDEVPTILQKGEGVFTPGQMAAMGGSNVNVTVINNASADVKTNTKEDANGGMQIEIMVDAIESAMANRMKRNGTTMNKAVRSVGDVRAR